MFECEANGLYFLLVNVSDQEIDGYAFNESDSNHSISNYVTPVAVRSGTILLLLNEY